MPVRRYTYVNEKKRKALLSHTHHRGDVVTDVRSRSIQIIGCPEYSAKACTLQVYACIIGVDHSCYPASTSVNKDMTRKTKEP